MRFALTNGRVVSGTDLGVIESGTVIVEESRICWVGPAEGAPVADCLVAECDGLTIIPGLCDAHAHVIYRNDLMDSYSMELSRSLEEATLDSVENAADLLRRGFTTIRDMGTRGTVALAIRNAINEGRIPGPRMKSAMQFLDTRGPGRHAPHAHFPASSISDLLDGGDKRTLASA